MGAILFENRRGVAFRVWAPHADRIYVCGDFNEWSETAHPMRSEGNGYWYTSIRKARPGQEYKYRIVNGEESFMKNDPYARQVTSSIGNSVAFDTEDFDWQGDNFQIAPWNEVVIYEMHVGTFHVTEPGKPGTFASAVEKLPYLRALGVNAVELMPAAEFPGGFSWGYNPAHPFAVESDYGGPVAFKEFVRAAHAHGIAVLFDVVYNHLGPTDLDLWRFDGWSENERGGIYFYGDWRAETPWGQTRPDYGREEVRRYITDNVLMWLEEYHLDGLRWDGTVFIRNQNYSGDPASDLPDGWTLMQHINGIVRARFPHKLIISEDLQGNEWLVRATEEGGAGFGSQWDSRFVHPIREALIPPDDAARDLHKVMAAMENRYGSDAFARVVYSESHDEVANGRARFPEEVWPGHVDSYYAKKRSTLAAGLVLTAPGIPMLFQGQEFLEDRWFHDTDPLDWTRAEDYEGIVLLYRELIKLRRNGRNTTAGLAGQNMAFTHAHFDEKLLVYHRWKEGGPRDSTVVVVNLANRAHEGYQIGLPRPGLWRVRFNSDWKGFDDTFVDQTTHHTQAEEGAYDDQPCNGTIDIGPYTVLILSQNE